MNKKSFFLKVAFMLLLMLSLGLYTTSYALTWSDVEDYIYSTHIAYPNNANATKMYNYMQSSDWSQFTENVNISNYTNFALDPYGNYFHGNTNFWFWKDNNTDQTMYVANSRVRFGKSVECTRIMPKATEPYYTQAAMTYNATPFANDSTILSSLFYVFMPIYTDSTLTTINTNIITTHGYSYIEFLTRTINLNDNQSDMCYIADSRVGTNFLNDTIQFMMYYNNNGVNDYYNGAFQSTTSEVTNGRLYQIMIDRTKIVNGKEYTIEAYSGQTLIATSSFNAILLYGDNSGGGNGSTSGESGGGNTINVDLTNTNNKIDSVKEEITTQGNAIISALESGEQKAEERQQFWEKAYNDLFVLDSGDVQELIDNVQEQIKIPSGEIADMTIILDLLSEEEPRRFCYFMG